MKLLKTNTNQYKDNFKNTLNTILRNYSDCYCENINDLLLCFNHEYNHSYNKKRFPNLQDRLSEYLKGLPYGFGFAYRYEILDFACLVHNLSKIPEDKEDIIIKNFYKHCAFMMLKLGDKTTVKELY